MFMTVLIVMGVGLFVFIPIIFIIIAAKLDKSSMDESRKSLIYKLMFTGYSFALIGCMMMGFFYYVGLIGALAAMVISGIFQAPVMLWVWWPRKPKAPDGQSLKQDNQAQAGILDRDGS